MTTPTDQLEQAEQNTHRPFWKAAEYLGVTDAGASLTQAEADVLYREVCAYFTGPKSLASLSPERQREWSLILQAACVGMLAKDSKSTQRTDQLQSLADAWAAKLGGKIGVVIRANVYAGPDNARGPNFSCEIGGDFAKLEKWRGFGPSLLDAQTQAELKWRMDGSPTRAEDAERIRLLARCRELGIQVENCGATVEN